MQNEKILMINSKLSQNITYDPDNDVIYISNEKANEYDIRCMIAIVKERVKLDITVDELKEALSHRECTITEENTNEIDEFFELIDQDNTLRESDWNEFKKWREEKALWNLDKDGEKTSLIDCFDNIVGFIENFPKTKGKIKFNKIRNIVEYDGRQVTDGDYHTFINYITKYFMPKFSKIKTVKDAVDNVGNKNKYNRWIDYFNNLEYDEKNGDMIEYTIKNVLCCEEQDKYYDLYYETLKIMLLACMSRIYNKEKGIATKYDMVVTFCGENGGSGKTTFFERLFDLDNNGNSYCYVVAGDTFQPRDKDFLERSHQCVCLLLDELTMKRSIVTSIKGYITQRDDRFRKAYGFNSESHLRGFIICGTSNNTDILKDYTTDNERRWGIIKISENTKNYINVNRAFDEGYRDKLWSFIKHLYEANESSELFISDKRLLDLEKNIQRDYKASNNADYNTIIDDFLEREYGFYETYDGLIINTNMIVKQYEYGDSKQWCKLHNKEVIDKEIKHEDGKYTMQPDDIMITKFGKINRISKSKLYEILKKLGFEYTKVTFNAEMKFSKRWNGWDRCKNVCNINHRNVNAYWRINEEDVREFNETMDIDTNKSSEEDNLPF